MNPTLEPMPVNPPKPLAKFTKVRADYYGDRDGWSWVFVIAYAGPLEKHPEDASIISPEETARILDFCRQHDYCVQSAGSGDPGTRYANEPWLDVFKTTIVVRQSGGLDT